MTVPEVHQFLPSLGYRDAVGNHTLQTRHVLAERGFDGQVWVEDAQPEVVGQARPYREYARMRSAKRRTNVLLYQASTGAHGMMGFIQDRPEPKALYYHNITPPIFFEPYDPAAATHLELGREDLRRFCAGVCSAMANSEFSAAELRALGIADPVVVPPFLPPDLATQPCASHGSWLRQTKKGIDVLFVGRVVPNKGHLHLLRAFAALRSTIDPGARLFVVGRWGPDRYMRAIEALRDRLGSEGIVFTGSITESRLAAHFQEADVYVSLSEHEGFCVPLVSAMRRDLPVVAYDAGAVAETLGGAGILLRTLDAPTVAEVVARAAVDHELRGELVRRQHERIAQLEAIPRADIITKCVEAALT